MASNITLSAGVRQNLLALQNTASLLSTTQNRLATGKKVNSALDNPTNFFTSSALSARASDLSSTPRLDGERHQHPEGCRQRPDRDHEHGREHEGDRSARPVRTASWKSDAYTIDCATIGTDNRQEPDVLGRRGRPATSTSHELTSAARAILTGGALPSAPDFDAAGTFSGRRSTSASPPMAARRPLSRLPVTSATNLTVSIGGAAVTNHTVADTDTVSNAELVSILNTAFDGAATPIAITASVGGTQTATDPIVFTSDVAASGDSGSVAVDRHHGCWPRCRNPASALAPRAVADGLFRRTSQRRPSTSSSRPSTPTPRSPAR